MTHLDAGTRLAISSVSGIVVLAKALAFWLNFSRQYISIDGLENVMSDTDW